ncbi:DUF4123 domain-containing protein [Billgrantia tianxiuensis]|jgi:hypothetical protein|uniref:DUF4123 domain-containing protein n=1 Tax=Billgrantia tianxiuensis TaxID=2497861 RepID=A0A6I6SN73_9GAMM|nr:MULTISPECIES: DUF4123 domain-containing protein [Halomonas]MCE8033245.1 DUF4123 domain-containing protein [Halomonas sp. MCCC 1A11057]QHC48987.1 DUF4123 domain-containing protein [Halomonas tianxiuensis]
MSSHDYWTGRCHLRAGSPTARRWEADADEAMVTVVVRAESEADMRARLLATLAAEGLTLVRLDAVQTLLQRFRREGTSYTLQRLADAISPRTPVAFGEMLPLLPEAAAPAEEPGPPPPPVRYDEITWPDLFTSTTPTSPPLWAVIDGVNCRDVMQRLASAEVQSACLYATTDAATRAIAPWLVRLEADSEIRHWLQSLPQDQHWGILLQSHATLKQLRSHLRKFTMLWIPANDQAPVYFRFYDPRVALDMAQALAPWKLAAFMAPLETLIVGLSPLMTVPDTANLRDPPHFAATPQEVQGRLLRLALSDAATERDREANAITPGRSFAIDPTEFARFGALQKTRAQRKLARELMEPYAETPLADLLAAVEAAERIGQRHGMTSGKQVATLAKCVLEFGQDFLHEYRDAQGILNHPGKLPWQKRKLMEEWIPRGRIRRDFLKQQAQTRVTLGAWVESP